MDLGMLATLIQSVVGLFLGLSVLEGLMHLWRGYHG